MIRKCFCDKSINNVFSFYFILYDGIEIWSWNFVKVVLMEFVERN